MWLNGVRKETDNTVHGHKNDMIRFADDTGVLTEEGKEELLQMMENTLRFRYKMSINKSKTKILVMNKQNIHDTRLEVKQLEESKCLYVYVGKTASDGRRRREIVSWIHQEKLAISIKKAVHF